MSTWLAYVILSGTPTLAAVFPAMQPCLVYTQEVRQFSLAKTGHTTWAYCVELKK